MADNAILESIRNVVGNGISLITNKRESETLVLHGKDSEVKERLVILWWMPMRIDKQFFDQN